MRRNLFQKFIQSLQTKTWRKTKAFLRAAENLKLNNISVNKVILASSVVSLLYATGTTLSASSEYNSNGTEEISHQSLTTMESQELVYLLAHHNHFPNQIVFLPSCSEELRNEVLARLKHKHLSRTAVAKINFEELDEEKNRERKLENAPGEEHKKLLAEMIDPGSRIIIFLLEFLF